HREAGTFDLDLYLPVAAVVSLILRRVAQRVVCVQVFVNFLQTPLEVVRIRNEEAAGLIRELSEAALRVEAQEVFIAFEPLRHRRAALDVVSLLRRPKACARLYLPARLLRLALGAQSRGVHRVDAHVVAVGRMYD